MADYKTKIRFFTIADYEEEESWLRSQYSRGWKLVKFTVPCFFTFERCQPEDMVYRLDYKSNPQGGDYFQLFADYGWEFIGQAVGWLYFRKPACKVENQQENQIFSDNESRINMIDHIIKTRMLPTLAVFLCCLLPNLTASLKEGYPLANVFALLFLIVTAVYLYLLVRCGAKLQKLRRKYSRPQ